ncbi:PadR family transcriptional regulator [Streptacidiphilus sp. ASG 303]|uniref:PadR family transcriptional regulator n=1 Tax=Streptacidiphilus sp. ASG 303 TaxID=2896847 RepID=UPI001E30DE74|nr:PadR family transcriptional regulator [Streptacidiphilus sp. ASG 303]MCD0483643.1 PadR family transcriptional regulator [Streptacidiphilus sp. ASG 303]
MPQPKRRSDDTGPMPRPPSVGGYVVLGLLLDGPASGWELARLADRSIGHFWPVTRAHIYAELPKLADRGWATARDVPQSGAPDKRVYRATAEGEAAFRSWLATVDLTEERGRQPLQLRLFFAAHDDPARLEELLAAWHRRAASTEEHCADILRRKGVDTAALPRLELRPAPRSPQAPDGGPPRLDARGMTALFGLRRAQADLAWLTEVRAMLGS